jgi:hypothetical protein
LDFDGGDDYVDCGDINEIDVEIQLTGSIWVKHGSTADDDYLFSKYDSTSGLLFLRDNADTVSGRTDCYTIFIKDGTDSARISTAAGSSVADIWTHITFTYIENVANGLHIYIDGIEDANSPVHTTNVAGIANAVDFLIGQYNSAGYLVGIIDEVRISKATRTADQIALFNDNKYGLYQPVGKPIWSIPAAPPVGAIMNQFQGTNLGADLFNGTLL